MKCVTVFFSAFVFISAHAEQDKNLESTCYGTTANGRLENAVQMPLEGNNYVSYSRLAHYAGRTWVHSQVKTILLEAWASLEAEQPSKIYKYAEIGFKEGGEFKPHKTHRNGLSVDFMTLMIDRHGNSVFLPTHPMNRFGYNIELDEQGGYKTNSIDYVAMAAHIVALHKAALIQGVDVWRVIFDPALQPPLFDTDYGPYLQENITFSTQPSWVRHDEHYHVDFAIPCKDL